MQDGIAAGGVVATVNTHTHTAALAGPFGLVAH